GFRSRLAKPPLWSLGPAVLAERPAIGSGSPVGERNLLAARAIHVDVVHVRISGIDGMVGSYSHLRLRSVGLVCRSTGAEATCGHRHQRRMNRRSEVNRPGFDAVAV